MELFPLEDCIFYAQEGIVDCRSIARTPPFIDFQHEVRPAVQAIVNLYSGLRAGNGCGVVGAFNISWAKEGGDHPLQRRFQRVLSEVKKRGYNLPNSEAEELDWVVVGIHLRKDSGTPPFDLDKALSEYYMERYDPISSK